MMVVLKPGEKLKIAFQENGVTVKSTVNLNFDKKGVLTLESPWPDNAGNKGIVYDSTKQTTLVPRDNE